MKTRTIILCCGKGGCPVLSVEEDTVKIKDDEGNTVIMELSQARLIGKAIDSLTDETEPTQPESS